MAFYGQPRTKVMTRLLQPVVQGDTEAYVEAGLDLVPGDEVYFAPTALLHSAFDYLIVLSYNDASGLLTLTTEF